MSELFQDNQYINFVNSIKDKIYKSQYEALKAVNKQLIELYWELGKLIVEKQEEEQWGKSIVEQLAKDLKAEFPNIKGFSSRNLWNMRIFYLFYKDNTKLQPLVAEISWTKNIIIIEKCKDLLQVEFYIKMTKKFGWTKDVLINQIESKAYERFLVNQNNFDKTLIEKYKNQAVLAVKDEYNFDFLDLGNEYSERELENSLISNVQQFLSEMGGYFTFVGSQYRLEIEGEEYFIDLLLYHRVLRSLIAIELKIGDFKPEYVGKMQFYLSVLDDKVKFQQENASIGIIICKNKKRTIVEYALKDAKKPIGVATYKIGDKLPEDIQNYLPSADEIAKRLSILDEDTV
jgi:predicted nuclease of restriction endonuclease-like (RecB) superfamily